MSRRISPATPTASPASAPRRVPPEESETAPAHSPPHRKYWLGTSGMRKREYMYCGTRLASMATASAAVQGPASQAATLAKVHRKGAPKQLMVAAKAGPQPSAG